MNGSHAGSAWFLLWAAALFYVVNMGTVAGVLCLLEHKSLNCMVEHWCIWSFSYYLAGALLALFVQSIAGLPLVPLTLILPLLIAHVVYQGYIRCLKESSRYDQVSTDREVVSARFAAAQSDSKLSDARIFLHTSRD